ncbi:MAG: hypothetical protein ACOZNI_26695, partial [Myxococcota bacterium]
MRILLRALLVVVTCVGLARARLDARLPWAPAPDPLAGEVSDPAVLTGLPGLSVSGREVRATSRSALEHARREARIAGARFRDPVESGERATARFGRLLGAAEA